MSEQLTTCNLCKDTKVELVYEGVVRSGMHGKYTSETHRVVKCEGCGLVRLEKNPIGMEFYQSNEYRLAYNDTDEATEYEDVHDVEQPPRLEYHGIESFRNKVVLDHGCGGGAFLDLVSGVASTTIGVEPFTGYHDALRNKGHLVYSNISEALADFDGGVDTVVSFGVLEHVEDPLTYLRGSFRLLVSGGKLLLETDNLNDILLKINSSTFESFFYRTAHLWYFDSSTLNRAINISGFQNVKIMHRHNFDLSNALLWGAIGKPTGNGKLEMIDSEVNYVWKAFLESHGYADLVCAVGHKP